jgi:hypothetical protein
MDGTAMTNKHFRLFAESFANAALGLCALDKEKAHTLHSRSYNFAGT